MNTIGPSHHFFLTFMKSHSSRMMLNLPDFTTSTSAENTPTSGMI